MSETLVRHGLTSANIRGTTSSSGGVSGNDFSLFQSNEPAG